MGIVRGIAAALFACGAATGCTTSATVTRSNGTSIEGWIRGGTDDSIIVDPRIGQRQEVPRSEISEIDHPGNVHIVLGGVVLAYGGVAIVASLSECRDENGSTDDCTAAFVPALAGAGIVAWGLVTWLGSKNALDDRSLPHLPPAKPHPPAERPSDAAPVVEPPAPPAVLPPLRPREPTPAPSGTAPAPTPPPPSAPAPEPAPEEPPGVVW